MWGQTQLGSGLIGGMQLWQAEWVWAMQVVPAVLLRVSKLQTCPDERVQAMHSKGFAAAGEAG